MKFAEVSSIEKRIYFYLCGFALFLSLSVAGANIFLGLTTAALIHRLIRKHDDVIDRLKQDKYVFASIFFLWGAVLLSIPGSEEPVRGLRGFIDYYIYRSIPFWAILFCVREKEKILRILAFFIVSLTINNCIAIGQLYLHYHESMWRLSGTIFYMHHASLLAASVPALLLLWLSGKAGQYKNVILVVLAIAVAAFFLNGTRGAWLAAAVTCAVTLWLCVKDKKRLAAGLFAAVIAVGGLAAVSSNIGDRFVSMTDLQGYQSNTERQLIWQSALHMVEDHPLTGVGMAEFAKEYPAKYILPEAKERLLTHAHSNVMHIFAECGFVGLSAFLFFWCFITFYTVRGWRKYHRIEYLLLLAVVTGVMLHGLTEYNFGATTTAKFFWLCMGLGINYSMGKCGSDLQA